MVPRTIAHSPNKAGLAHVPLNLSAGERVKGIYHIQNVNNYDSRLKSWMRRFNGVATKYLDSYLGSASRLRPCRRLVIRKLRPCSRLGDSCNITPEQRQEIL